MNKDNKCQYVFKKGQKKGILCNKFSCELHKEIQNYLPPQIELKPEENIKQKILNLETNIENKTVIMKHYQNLQKLDPSTSEYYKNQLFIDKALSVPWNKWFNLQEQLIMMTRASTKTFIDNIKNEFDKEIYGMENVKNEIINYICKFITNPYSQKNNIALYGPAGVCKTKFIKILSKILGMPLKIISLGGVKDSNFLLGNGYVYVESNCGAIIDSVIESQVMNPILYFDELDKVSNTDYGQDIYSVLCNVTDHTINSKFSDHYFRGIHFDLSKIFYIFTFNDITKINKVLLDRLNVIYVENPSNKDKVKILEKHCLPEIILNIGLQNNIIFDQECYEKIINYTQRQIDKNVSSGIRECVRILEKILLEINKEILLNYHHSMQPLHITIDLFRIYFNKLKNQFLLEENQNYLNMYI
jgi:ATP-dependent Lon protease